MKEIVINRCYGGFWLSGKAISMLQDMGNEYILNNKYHNDIPRDDPDLIAVVKELGEKANEQYSRLQIVEIPDDVDWQIEEYDGMEWVSENHRTWS